MKDKITDAIIKGVGAVLWFVFVVYFTASAFSMSGESDRVTALERSHAIMWERQKILKDITCGYCHDTKIEWRKEK